MTISAIAAPVAKLQFTDNAGAVLNGGLLYVYLAGTTTKATTYQDAQQVAQNTNPIVLDAAGRVPAGLFLVPGTAYKFVLSPSTDSDPPTNAIWTIDNMVVANNDIPYIVDTGTANTLVASGVVGIPLVATAGASILVKLANAITSAVTLEVTAQGGTTWGAIAVKDQSGSALTAGAGFSGQPILFTYDGTFWRATITYPWPVYVVDSGTNNAMVATAAGLPSTLVAGISFNIKTATSCTASATANLNTTGAVTLKDKNGSNMTSGAYAAAQIFPLTYDGTNWRTLF